MNKLILFNLNVKNSTKTMDFLLNKKRLKNNGNIRIKQILYKIKSNCFSSDKLVFLNNKFALKVAL